ncbi:putative hydrolases or acyltransferase [Dactylonectria estremocensis]|uniref:Hydrolases or acyltransferase n=1 Tax=Dactylonectria estremocensis TaxID=1079267 RepID=A0A9P9IJS1_9HYPO|nr:putative hydrolases or acyltransferase [Dactylonectria estremocensis]
MSAADRETDTVVETLPPLIHDPEEENVVETRSTSSPPVHSSEADNAVETLSASSPPVSDPEADGRERTSQVIKTPDSKRDIGFAEYGSQSGSPVFYFHGLPGSRFEALFWEANATALGVRLIALDRPGMGLSTRDSARTMPGYPADVAAVAKHLKLERYFVLAVSGGSGYALACAEQKDQLPGLQGVGVVGGLGPRNLTQKGMGLIQRLSYYAMDWVPHGAVGWLWDAMIGKSARNPDPTVLEKAVRKGLKMEAKGPDAEIVKDENILRALADSLRGAFAQGSHGYVDEASLVVKPWGFNLEDIKDVQVRLWYGEKDELAPPAVGKAMADKIPGAVFTEFEGESHTASVVKHQQVILTELCGLETENASRDGMVLDQDGRVKPNDG